MKNYRCPLGGAGRLLFSWRLAISSRQTHISRRHDCRNSVLIDHLGDGVFQQHHKLVEGFDLSLKLDAVDQVDLDGNPFLAQGVKVRVL